MFRLQQELFLDFEAAKALGLSSRSIRSRAKGRGIGSKDVNQILKGEFQPLEIGNNIVQDAYQQEREGEGRLISAKDLSRLRGELNKLAYRQLRGLNLKKSFPRVSDEDSREETTSPVSSVVTPPTTTAVRPPVAPITPVVTPSVQGRSAINPGLLGDNPVEIQRNLELASRTRSQ